MANMRVEADESNFVAGLRKASGSVGALAGKINEDLVKSFKGADFYSKNFEKGIGRLGNAFKDAGMGMTIGLTLPLGLLAKSASDAYAEFDSLKKGLATLEPTTQGLTSRLAELREIAKAPGIGFQEAIQGDLRLRSVGIAAATSAKILKEFANAVALTGGGKEQLNEITVQLGQMSAKGKVLAQDLRPIIEAAPAVSQALKNMFGTVSSEAISEMLEKTGKTSTDMINMLLVELSKAPRVTGGWKNALENLNTSLFIAKAEMFEVADSLLNLQGFIGSITSSVEGLVSGFKDLPEPVQRGILGFAALAAILGPASYGIGLLITSLGALTTMAGLTTVAIGGIALVLGALGIAYASAYSEGKKVEEATRSLSDVHEIAALSIKKEVDAIQDNIEVLRDSSSSIDDVKIAKEELIKINPEFKSAINGDIINFSKLSDVASKTADELLRVAKYQKLIEQKETSVKALEGMGKSKLSGLSFKQMFAAGLLSQSDGSKDAYQEIKDENERKIRENIWFIDKTIEKEYGDLAKKYEKKDSPTNKALTAILGNKSDEGKPIKNAGKRRLDAFIKMHTDEMQERDNQLKERLEKEKEISLAIAEEMDISNLPKAPEVNVDRADDLNWKITFGDVKPLKGLSEEEWKAWIEVNEKSKKGQDAYVKQFDDMKENLHNVLGEMSIEFGADLIEGLVSGKGFEGALSGMLKSLGNVMIQFGKQALIANNAFKVFKTAFNIAPGSSGASAKALGLIAGGAIMKGLGSRIPKLAEGGMATNPTLAMIGDNKSGKEMVLPFEKTGQFANMIAQQMGGGGGNFSVSTKVSGNDLLILVERAKRTK